MPAGKKAVDVLAGIGDALGLGGLRSELDKFQAAYRNACSELENLRRTREETAAAPATAADLQEAVSGWVDSQAVAYQKRLRETLGTIATLGSEVDTAFGTGGRSHLGRLFAIHPQGGSVANDLHVQPGAAILVLGPEAVKAAFAREIEALGLPRGLPLAERTTKLSELDATIGKLEAEITKLRRDAAAAGIILKTEQADGNP